VHNELELWQFIGERLGKNESVMLLVVAESSGSSPGRQGYKMAVGAGGELIGSIGGGVMEVNLVEQSRAILSEPPPSASGHSESSPPYEGGVAEGRCGSLLITQVHRKNSSHASGMICSGKQTVIFRRLFSNDAKTVDAVIDTLTKRRPDRLIISRQEFSLSPSKGGTQNSDFHFNKLSDTEFTYSEKLGFKNDLYIIGGGHCALALSELVSRMDFHISLFDDRPELNTIDKNRFAHEITIIDGYDQITDYISSGDNIYVVVMTLGYRSDEIVIRKLLDKRFKYFGVLGSTAKMGTLMNALKTEGYDPEKLTAIHTPIGLAINSRTPEEIAVSIAAEIIAVKNAD
jgi:xanthine dehydrogenase accessory factor